MSTNSDNEVCRSTSPDPYTKNDDHECQLPHMHLYGNHQCACGHEWEVDVTPMPDPFEMTDEDMWTGIGSDLHFIANQIYDDSTGWFGEEVATDIGDAVMGLSGESAEALEAAMHLVVASGKVSETLKKVLRGSLDDADPAVRDRFGYELVDVFIYLLKAARIIQFDLVKGYRVKRDNNHRRFSDANSPDQSNLDAEVRRRQQGALGPAAFVPESVLQSPVPEENLDGGVSDPR